VLTGLAMALLAAQGLPSAEFAGALRPPLRAPGLRLDPTAAPRQGIRTLAGRHLTLWTDLAPCPEVDALPAAFDQAFPQWCEYFRVSAEKYAGWKMNGMVMKDQARFRQAGLLPESVPPFANGFEWNFEFWVCDQPSDYYRRHLVLHEGTHGFMNTILGSCGPPWYREGIAELLGTHRWQDGRLALGYLPRSRDEVPMWGRVRIIRDAVAEHRALGLRAVLDYQPEGQGETEPYAWCWAAALLLDRHPRYRDRFRQLTGYVRDRDFQRRFQKLFAADWEHLAEEWQVMVADMHYGQDIPRTAIDFSPGRPLPAAGAAVAVTADRGWQNSGLVLQAGTRYRLDASGRFQLGQKPQVWGCEPGGVSIRYHAGQPLGVLLGAVRPEHLAADRPSPLVRPVVVGLGTTIVPETTGTLYLKLNDSPAELADNAGTCRVRIGRP